MLQLELVFNRAPGIQSNLLYMLSHSSDISRYFAVFFKDGDIISEIRFNGKTLFYVHQRLQTAVSMRSGLSVSLNSSTLELAATNYTTLTNTTSTSSLTSLGRGFSPEVFDQIYIGGLSDDILGYYHDLPTTTGFFGCILHFRMFGNEIDLTPGRSSMLSISDVRRGCCVEESNVTCSFFGNREPFMPPNCTFRQFNVTWRYIQVIPKILQVSEGSPVVMQPNIFVLYIINEDYETWAKLEPLLHENGQVTIILPPQHGHMEVDGNTITTFSYRDLTEQSVDYIHDGSETTMDSMKLSFSVTCSNVTIVRRNFTIPIVISPQNDAPFIVEKSKLFLAAGTRRVILPSIISVDDPDSDPISLRFELAGAIGQGQFELTEVPGKSITMFRQSQLFDGNVSFQHFKREQNEEFFFLMSFTDNFIFRYHRFYVSPYEGAIHSTTANCLSVIEQSFGFIEPNNFNITTTFEDQKPLVVITLTSEPLYGSLQLFTSADGVEYNWMGLSVGDSFTRHDTRMRRVRYIHEETLGNSTSFDYFNLSVHSYEVQGSDILFCVKSIPLDSLKDTQFDLSIATINVQEGDSSFITEHNLNVSTHLSEVLYTEEFTFKSIKVTIFRSLSSN